MGLSKLKDTEDVLLQTLTLQRPLVRKRSRRPTARKSFQPSIIDIIGAELESRFGRYICPDAVTIIDKIDSVVCSVQNRALYWGVTPEVRENLRQLLRWKEELAL